MPAISCAEMAQIKPKVAIVRGGATRAFFRVVADAAARCVPTGTHIVIPNVSHMWLGEDPAAFSNAVPTFIAPTLTSRRLRA